MAIILGSYAAGNLAYSSEPSDFFNGKIQITSLGCSDAQIDTDGDGIPDTVVDACTWNVNNIDNKKTISHVVIGLETCTIFAVGTEPDTDEIPQLDPTTLVFGQKWETEIMKGQNQDFTLYFLVPSDTHSLVPDVEDNESSVKTGKQISKAAVFGPACFLDITPPEITVVVSDATGDNGWNIDEVTVTWTVIENESPILSSSGCDNTVISIDTTGTTLTCTATSGGGTSSLDTRLIKLDTIVPTISGVLDPASPTGNAPWYTSNPDAVYTCGDVGGSGVFSCESNHTFSSEGADQNFVGTAVDVAGNENTFDVTGVFVDTIVPTISGVLDPASPTGNAPWYTSNPDAVYTCGDVGGSGVFSCESNHTFSSEGADQNFVGTAVDVAGNENTFDVTGVFVDTVAPTLIVPAAPAPIQATTINGEARTFDDPTGDDATSGMADTFPNCNPTSGSVFDIGTTTVQCESKDNAGLSTTGTFGAIVEPYVAFSSDETPSNGRGELTISHPDAFAALPADGTITATLSTDSGQHPDLLLQLSKDDTVPDNDRLFTAEVLFTPVGTIEDSTPEALGTEVGDIVTANYPGTVLTSTDTTSIGPPFNVGASSANAILDQLRWTSDVYYINQQAQVVTFRDFCNTNDQEFYTVSLASFVSPGNNIGFTPSLQLSEEPDGNGVFNTCNFLSDGILLTNTNDFNSSPIKLNVVDGGFIRTSDLASTPSGNSIRDSSIFTSPGNIPVDVGSAIPSTALGCGAGDDLDSDYLCDNTEKSTGLQNSHKGVTYRYHDNNLCPRLYDDPSDPFNDDTLNPRKCPDPKRKDLFVEIDWMQGHKPNRDTIIRVISMFDNANTGIPCSGCSSGINLHVRMSEELPIHQIRLPLDQEPNSDFVLGGLKQVKINSFGDQADRDLGEKGMIVYKNFWHYSLWVHQMLDTPLSAGYAEVGGDTTVISMGSFSGSVGSTAQQSASFAHELGHNLHLHHGGAQTDIVNGKPNYISLMNYGYEFLTLDPDRRLDFSRSKLNQLNENCLDETVGITKATPPTIRAVYGPGEVLRTDPLSSNENPIDWNRIGGAISTCVQRNINNLGIFDANLPGLQVLNGYHDWLNVNFDFRGPATFADGAQSLSPLLLPFQRIEPDPTNTQTPGNNDPIADAGPDQTVPEGTIVTLDSSGSSDVEDGTDLQFRLFDINNNGAPDEIGIDAEVTNEDPTTLIFVDDQGSNTITLFVWDFAERGDTDEVVITGTNVAPVVDAGADVTINENDSIDPYLATFADQGIIDINNIATIDWGDGSAIVDCDNTTCLTETVGQAPDLVAATPRVDLTGEVSGSHTYLDDDDDDMYTLTVTVTDKDGGVTSDSLIVTVNNVAPTVDAGADPAAVNEGDLVDFGVDTVSFTDPGTLDTHTATIDYETDGTIDVTIDSATSPFTIPAHPYADDTGGPFTVTVTVTDDDGGSHSDTLTVTVNNVAPTVDAGADPADANVGDLVDFGVDTVSFTDPGADTWIATIDY